jgi:arylsulfatase A-like enzyme
VLFISIDSLRADHVGAYGYDRPTTPVIDSVAESGAVFETALSTTSWTLPSHAAMLTGLVDRAHRVTAPKRTLGPGIPTLAEAFSDAGYRTVGLYSGPFLHKQFGLSRGFDEFVDCTSYQLAAKPSGKDLKLHNASHGDITNPNIARNFFDTLSRTDEKPIFYFVHMWDVHYDLIPPAPFDTMFDPDYEGSYSGHNFRHDPKFKKGMPEADRNHVLALYNGEIRYTDTTIGELLDALRAEGRLENTIIAITSDHGEEFLDHGGKGHKQSIYQEVIRVPLVISWPGKIREEREETPVSIVDIAPTLLSLAGIPPLPFASGRALFDSDGAPANRDAKPVLSELFNDDGKAMYSSVVYEDAKVIDGLKMKNPLYFDLGADPSEMHPSNASRSADGRKLLKMLKAEIARAEKRASATPDSGRSKDHELSDDVSERLRSLGYLE